MKRTRGVLTKQERDIRTNYDKLIATAYNIGKYFPGAFDKQDCQELYENHMPTADNLAELKSHLRKNINWWFRETGESDPDAILTILDEIRVNEKMHPFMKQCRELVRPKYRYYFDHDHKAMPAICARPSIFFPSSASIEKTIVRKYGEGSVAMRSTALQYSDLQTTVALLYLTKRKHIRMNDAFISFEATTQEIAKVMQKSNPSARDIRKSIWDSLRRLREASITWYDKNGEPFALGGILAKCSTLPMEGTMRVHIDKDFVNLMDTEKWFVSLDLDVIFQLPAREAFLYYFLKGNRAFLQGNNFKIGLFKFADYTGQSGLTEKPKYTIRRDVKAGLERLKKRGIIKSFKIEPNDMLVISRTKLLHEPEPAKQIGDNLGQQLEEKIRAQKEKNRREGTRCPFGYKFGESDMHGECNDCNVWDDCDEYATEHHMAKDLM